MATSNTLRTIAHNHMPHYCQQQARCHCTLVHLRAHQTAVQIRPRSAALQYLNRREAVRTPRHTAAVLYKPLKLRSQRRAPNQNKVHHGAPLRVLPCPTATAATSATCGAEKALQMPDPQAE